MKISLSVSLFFSFSVLLGLNSANAAIVKSALAPNQIGISADQLMATTASNVALPISGNRPVEMTDASKGIHLGTNTDLFLAGNTFWVRYTLDSSSNKTNINHPGGTSYNSTPITGELWLSFGNLQPAAHNLTDNPNLFRFSQITGTYTTASFPPIYNRFTDGSTGEPDYQQLPSNADLSNLQIFPCVECYYVTTLNLSFVSYRAGQLFTSGIGFDQILHSTSNYIAGGYSQSYALNIAPVPAQVPIPASIWLMGSGIIGLIGIARRRQ